MSTFENSEALTKMDHLIGIAKELRKGRQNVAAEGLMNEALVICKQLESEDAKHLYQILDELGTIAFWNGKHPEAEQYYKEALETAESATYASHSCVAPILDHLAHLYIAMDRFDSAGESARRALAVRRATVLKTDAATLESMRMCAIIEIELDHMDEAKALLREAIAILEPATIGPFEEFVYLMAQAYQMEGRNADAEGCYKQALLTFESRRGRPARHASCLQDYANFLRQQGRVKDAEKLEPMLPRLNEAVVMEEAAGTSEVYHDLPNTDIYQVLSYPVTIFH
ncbi:MAG: tetratricopeptide repeat protein [Candidatus Obscuribacterales bacterium]|nr:tetratricopeptide repeat protein [Candidatus Obscuribacterales bacterium]